MTIGAIVAGAMSVHAEPAHAADKVPLMFGCERSDFTYGNEGWRIASVFPNDGVTVVDQPTYSGWTDQDGLPPGSLRNRDLSGGSSTELWTPVFNAMGYTTDYSAVVGKNLSFDYKQETQIIADSARYMSIVAANGTRYWTVFENQLDPNNFGWQRVSVPMSASAWTSIPLNASDPSNWFQTGIIDPKSSPSDSSFLAALRDVDRFVFATEYTPKSWSEIALFDNFGIDCSLAISKSSDASVETRVGDTVTYTVTATNTGSGDYTKGYPARIVDDLTGVLDDGEYLSDASSDKPGKIGFSSSRLTWEGELAVGESVTLTYTVKMKPGGDRNVKNVAFIGNPETPNQATPDCAGKDSTVACEEFLLPALTIEKSADRDSLPRVGDLVTYTVAVTNAGPGIYTEANPASASDDLSDVLDDAKLDEASLTASVGTVEVSGQKWFWTGALAAGETASISYTLEYTGDGNQELINTACAPAAQVLAGREPCAIVSVPGAKLERSKESAPSAEPLNSGDYVDYTLWFENLGKTAADVDDTDFIGYLMDDAVILDGPTAGVGNLTATLIDDRIRVVGSVPAGERYSITYRAEVKPEHERGDNLMVNHLLAGNPTDPPLPPKSEEPCVDTKTSTCDPLANITYVKNVSSDTDPVGAGSVLTYTISIKNTGETEGIVAREDLLVDVLDDADLTAVPESDTDSVTVSDVSGERFSIGGKLEKGATATITYQVTVKDEADRGNNSADNFLVSPGANPPAGCEEDSSECTSTPLPRIVAGKTVTPLSGTTVQAGEELVYTLTFMNTGAATGALDYTDDLAGVLDDAEIIGVPVTSAGIAQASDGSNGVIQVIGSLEPGESATVSYTVKVKPDGQRGDNVLRNAVVKTGTDECAAAEGAQCSTENPVPHVVDSKSVNPASGTPVVAEQELTYELKFENIGAAAGRIDKVDDLTHVLDDADIVSEPVASNGAVSVSRAGERMTVTGEIAAGETVTVIYKVKVRAEVDRGDDILANYLLAPGVDAPEEPICDATSDKDCTVNPVGDIKPSKSVDPETGTKVKSGNVLTYTLSFENTGQGTAAVNYTDHMSGVLDDAVMIDTPVASDGLNVTGSENGVLNISGSVAPGEIATVVYAVKVKAYEDQGDNRLGNFLTVAGEQPPTGCETENPLCTENPVDPPAEGLAFTGSQDVAAVVGVGLLVMLAGGALVAASTRRRKLTQQ